MTSTPLDLYNKKGVLNGCYGDSPPYSYNLNGFPDSKDQLESRPSVTSLRNNQSSIEKAVTVQERSLSTRDPYAVVIDETSLLEQRKTKTWQVILKVLCALLLLYLFICSLGLMGTAFRLISGKTTGAVLQNKYINNPIVGLMIGILVTVLVQSSSTSTSIIVSMVNAEILRVHQAIPMIMGTNIGTSVTNTIVSLTQIADKDQFRRAFAGATVHDMFNWLTVITLLVIEIPSGMLEKLTGLIVDKAFVFEEAQKATKIKILKHLTEPLTKIIVKIDKKVLTGWSQNDTKYDNMTLNPCFNAKMFHADDHDYISKKCGYLFAYIKLDDTKSGIILLLISLFLLCFALVMMVKILKSVLQGSIATVVKKVINSDIPYMPWLTGYLAILVGAVMTVIVQSSSIFTSTLTPLIGLGLISVDRAYPLTLGSNIGTTTTSLLASIAGEGLGLKRSVQIALVHLFFNIIGILIFYPIPFMRLPIPLCKILGNITAEHRWFAIIYLVIMFFFLPGFVFILSLGGPVLLQAVGIPLLIVIIFVIVINVMQRFSPKFLPSFLKNWNFLPRPLRSLDPYDRVILMAPCCRSCRIVDSDEDGANPMPIVKVEPAREYRKPGLDNPSFNEDHTKL